MEIITTYCQCDLCLAIRKIQQKEASMQRFPLTTNEDATGPVVGQQELVNGLWVLVVGITRETGPYVSAFPDSLLDEPL